LTSKKIVRVNTFVKKNDRLYVQDRLFRFFAYCQSVGINIGGKKVLLLGGGGPRYRVGGASDLGLRGDYHSFARGGSVNYSTFPTIPTPT
jgi:hypothetical protein